MSPSSQPPQATAAPLRCPRQLLRLYEVFQTVENLNDQSVDRICYFDHPVVAFSYIIFTYILQYI